jgi:hypothetical protein
VKVAVTFAGDVQLCFHGWLAFRLDT